MPDDIESFLALRDDVASPVEPKLVAGRETAWDDSCDVLVIGFGLAGACAAIEAADRGLDVLLIDRFRGGGSSEMSGGVVYAGGGTPVQQECGVRDSPEAMADYLLKEVAGLVSEATVRKFCGESVETLDFAARQGVHFSGPAAPRKTSYPPPGTYLYYSDNGTVPAYRGSEPPAERGHRCKDPALIPGARLPMGRKPHGGFTEGADMGWHMMAAMKLAVAEHPRIRVIPHSRAERLVADASGAIVGAQLATIPAGSRAARRHAWAEARANRIPW
jgi:3-oxo-5alpha-steroid 4-dehydrogenase